MVVRFCDRARETMNGEEEGAKVEAQKLLWSWLETQTSNTPISRRDWSAFKAALPHVPGLKDTTPYEEIHEDFIMNPVS